MYSAVGIHVVYGVEDVNLDQRVMVGRLAWMLPCSCWLKNIRTGWKNSGNQLSLKI